LFARPPELRPLHAPRTDRRRPRCRRAVEEGMMLIRNAAKLCTERGFQGRLEPAGYGVYGFVITTSGGQYRLPVITGVGPVADTGRVNGTS
jgi:hypothetical protein